MLNKIICKLSSHCRTEQRIDKKKLFWNRYSEYRARLAARYKKTVLRKFAGGKVKVINMNKKWYSVIIAAAIITTSVSTAFAFGGTYPEHNGYAGMVEQGTSSKQSNTASDPDYLFTVEGKKFILLDKDSEGNYFVMTDDLYGKHTYDTTYANRPTIKERKANGTFVDGAAYDVDDKEWMFNTEDETNIGYWLNNDFWNSGNGAGNVLPEAIKENVIEFTWQVEGMKAIRGWTANSNFDSKYKVTYAKDFADSRVTEPYQVSGKLALMSYTEYLKYQNIIGLVHNEDVWRGFMLRTPHAVVNGDTSKIFYTYGGGMVKNANSGGMLTCVNDTPASANMFVRPVMWLDKNFFKNVKIDIASAGKYPKAEIEALSFEDLLNTYSLEDIKNMNSTSVNAPKVKHANLIGTPAVGSAVYIDYTFSSNKAEKDSEIYWLESGSDGKYKVAAKDAKKYIPAEAGKDITCVVIPKDESGEKGELTAVNAMVSTIEPKTFTFSDLEVSDEKITVKFSSGESKDNTARIICATYDSNNKLISVNSKTVAAENDAVEEILLSPKNAGENVTVMILAEENQPVLVVKK